jgi:hypothetical protein
MTVFFDAGDCLFIRRTFAVTIPGDDPVGFVDHPRSTVALAGECVGVAEICPSGHCRSERDERANCEYDSWIIPFLRFHEVPVPVIISDKQSATLPSKDYAAVGFSGASGSPVLASASPRRLLRRSVTAL